MSILDYLDYDTFLSVWYWVLVVIAWSLNCHYTMGVPFDVVVRANRLGGQHAADCENLALIHARRVGTLMRRGGPFLVAGITFLLAALATLGFWLGYEIAMAFFMLAAPVGYTAMHGALLSQRVLASGINGAELRKMIASRRFRDQVVGVLSVMVTAFITAWLTISADLQASDGITLSQVLQTLLANWF